MAYTRILVESSIDAQEVAYFHVLFSADHIKYQKTKTAAFLHYINYITARNRNVILDNRNIIGKRL